MVFLRTLIFLICIITAMFINATGNSLDFYGDLCDENQVMLAFSLDSFDSAVTWSRPGLTNPIGCSQFSCNQISATIDGNLYSFKSNSSGAYVSFQITIKDYGIEWTCNFNSINYKYLITDDNCGSTPSQQKDGITGAVVGCVCGIIIIIVILYVIYRCSNKNCKTHEQCWLCQGKCYSDFQLVTRNLSEVWNIEHYCLKPCCQIKECNNTCCSIILCFGCCLKEFPDKRIKENSQPLTTPPKSSAIDEQGNNNKRKKKKKKSSQSAKENNDDPNPPVEKHTKEEKAVHYATENDTKSVPNPSGERSVSLDSLNSKSNKIHPAEDEQVNDTK